MLRNLFKRVENKSGAAVEGITIHILQRQIELFTTERLNEAMQQAWHRPHDPTTFYATNLNGEGAVIKFGSMFIPITHHNHRLGHTELDNHVLPRWADHSAFSTVSLKVKDGIPDAQQRHQFNGFMGGLCAQLLRENSVGLFFQEEGSFLPNTAITVNRLKLLQPLNPAELHQADLP